VADDSITCGIRANCQFKQSIEAIRRVREMFTQWVSSKAF
jgi:hypothetical protein